MNIIDVTLSLVASAILGVVLPWLSMRMLAPSLAESGAMENYRGRRVYHGLGVVWLLWSGAAFIGSLVISSTTAAWMLSTAAPLALACFAFGMVDDAFGTSTAKGFRGHLTALAHARLTTGGLKLFGISLVSYIAGLSLVLSSDNSSTSVARALVMALPAGAAIALTSNFVNLTDLRPGRALKSYVFLAVLGAVGTATLFGPRFATALESPGGPWWLDLAVLLLFAIGPVVAVWRYDLGEAGMLGDAGANAMGAVAGLLIVVGLPMWALLVYLAVMLAVNLVSERVSFSRVIEDNGLLARIDTWGRLTDMATDDGTTSDRDAP